MGITDLWTTTVNTVSAHGQLTGRMVWARVNRPTAWDAGEDIHVFCLSACLSVCLSVSVCLSICLSICLPACLSVCLSVALSHNFSKCVILRHKKKESACTQTDSEREREREWGGGGGERERERERERESTYAHTRILHNYTDRRTCILTYIYTYVLHTYRLGRPTSLHAYTRTYVNIYLQTDRHIHMFIRFLMSLSSDQ